MSVISNCAICFYSQVIIIINSEPFYSVPNKQTTGAKEMNVNTTWMNNTHIQNQNRTREEPKRTRKDQDEQQQESE